MDYKNLSMIDFPRMSRGERIKHRRFKLKLSPAYIAKYVGVSRIGYLNWEEGRVEDISWPKFMKLADVLLTTPHWLEYGKTHESYIFNDAEGDITSSLQGVHIIKSTGIPVRGTIGAISEDGKHTEVVDMPAKSTEILALRVDVDLPIYRAHTGDALILDPNSEMMPGEEIYLHFKKKPGVICTFNYKKDGQINCSTDSGKVIFEESEVDKIYAVVGVARNGSIKKRR